MKRYKAGIVVVGGGPAGSLAAIAAARMGADVLLVEQYGCLGGMSTMGCVNPWMTFHDGQDRQVIAGFAGEIADRLKELGASPGHLIDTIGEVTSITPFDPEVLKVVLADLCLEAGVKILYHTFVFDTVVSGGRVTILIAANKGGECRIEGDIFVDCTGDADIATRSGCPVETGRQPDGLMQPATMNFTMANVDFEPVRRYMLEQPGEFHAKTRFDTLASQLPSGVSGFYTIWNRLNGELQTPVPRDRFLFFRGYRQDIATVNTSRIPGIDSTSAEDLTRGELVGRRQAMDISRGMIQYLPGFENAFLLGTAPVIGIRESRRIVGEYVLDRQDILSGRSFEDDVMANAYTVDIHGADDKGSVQYAVPTYGIPYRSLLPQGIENLIVAGRSISTSREVQGSIRTTPSCMAMGQAAGTAAAMACIRGNGVKELDTAMLREQLARDGAFLL